MIDISGRVVISQQEMYNGPDYTVLSSGILPSGVYFVTVKSGKATALA